MPFDEEKGEKRKSNFNDTLIAICKALLKVGSKFGLGLLIDILLDESSSRKNSPHDFFEDIEVERIPEAEGGESEDQD